MELSPGTSIGAYQIVSQLGAGGMGEVYRARDRKLNRIVALKVLLEAFAGDAERMARFEHEAQMLASLNHSGIAAIYGLEENVNGSTASKALVMELAEGPTLVDLIAKGAIPVDEALLIARQIAEALEYAHERGIIHRDLKPANVKISEAGQVKLLDFGLAKALEPSGTGNGGSGVDLTQSPTIAVVATQAGIILGTAAYMSPEQARGKPVDKRSDIWSFGVVLFEMLTGRCPFEGETVSDTLASVLRQEIDWARLPANAPPALVALMRRCLERDPRRRLRDIGDARIVIEETLAGAADVGASLVPALGRPQGASPQSLWRRALPWGVATVLGLALVSISLWVALRPTLGPASSVRLSVELGGNASLDANFGPAAALSRDGKVLAFSARPTEGGPTQLFVRQLEHAQATPLAGTEQAYSPFFSPDGRWIAFFSDRKLKKISVTGGTALTLCDAPEPRGGDWAEDGSIVFAPAGGSGLLRVSEAGGAPVELTKLDSSAGEITHRWPQLLPGGKALLFTGNNHAHSFDYANIVVQRLSTGQRRIVQRGGTFGRYLPGGYLIYLHGATLFAAPFDLDRLEMTGTPVPVVEGVSSDWNGDGAAQIAFSAGGTLLYLPGQRTTPELTIFWMGPDGKTAPLRNVPAQYGEICLSPDGQRLATELLGVGSINIWVYEWQRDTMLRLTLGAGDDGSVAWTPDGLRIAFASDRAKPGVRSIYWQRADGAGEVQRLTESNNSDWPKSWHPSGRFLAFEEENRQSAASHIMILPVEGSETAGWKPGKPFAFLNSASKEGMPMFSPDGRWLAYLSDESGRRQVYVRPFPGPGGKWQISTNGGVFPTWSRNGKELFYQEDNGKIMVVGYRASGGEFEADKPRAWSPVPVPLLGANRSIDVSRDGKRLAVVLRARETHAAVKDDHITFLFNFTDELRRIASPAKK